MSDRPSGPEFVAKIRAALDALHELVKRHAKRPAVLSTTFLPEIKIEGHLKNIRAIRKTAWHGGIGVPGDSFMAIMSLDELLSMLPADDDIAWTWKTEWTEALGYILSLLSTPTAVEQSGRATEEIDLILCKQIDLARFKGITNRKKLVDDLVALRVIKHYERVPGHPYMLRVAFWKEVEHEDFRTFVTPKPKPKKSKNRDNS